jgi:hypothetical protein
VSAGPDRKHDSRPPARLKRRDPFRELAYYAGLRDAPDRQWLSAPELQDEAGPSRNPLGGRAAYSDERELVVGDLADGRAEAGQAVEVQ